MDFVNSSYSNYTIGTWIFFSFLGIFLLGIIVLYIWDYTQKEHTILRNYPILGYFRYLFEFLGVYFRQYFFASDREELPFNRAERSWVYRSAKGLDTTIGFGSTRDLRPVGTVLFVDAPFPVLGEDAVETQPVTIGPYCRFPYITDSLFNISAMSYGSISKNAVLALSHGAKMGGCWLNTGEGGVSNYHLEGGCDIVAQIGTAKYGFRDIEGKLSPEALRGIALFPQIKMFELKLSQGAKPGKGGILPGVKVTPEVAAIRFIQPYVDSISPNRHPEISNVQQLLDMINYIRDLTGKPTGFKIVIGSYEWLEDLCKEILKRGIEKAPDFISLDGAEGGTGAAPQSLVDYMGLPIAESLPVLIDILVEYGLKERIKVNASGKLITPGEIAWALCVGADFVSSARGFAFALGCIQALRCQTNTCPTGVATHQPHLVRGLDPQNKAVRVANYVKSMLYEVGTISHSCGVKEPRALRRKHARIMSDKGISVPLDAIYPDKISGIKAKNVAT